MKQAVLPAIGRHPSPIRLPPSLYMGQMALHCYISTYGAPELPLLFMLMSHAHLKIHSSFQFHFFAPTKSFMPESFKKCI
jgi:hypothetical protein